MIKNDTTEEFINLKNELRIHLRSGFDVTQTKQFLQTHVPREVIYKSEILLDTLLNYLMKDARTKIKVADVQLQNAFFNANFRDRIREWATQVKNKLTLEPELVNYTFDPRLKQGLIASSITLAVGTGITLIIAPHVIEAIAAGIVTIVLSGVAFKLAYDKASPQARELIKKDIDKYLETSKNQVIEWLGKVEIAFQNDFSEFCSKNGFNLAESLK